MGRGARVVVAVVAASLVSPGRIPLGKVEAGAAAHRLRCGMLPSQTVEKTTRAHLHIGNAQSGAREGKRGERHRLGVLSLRGQ